VRSTANIASVINKKRLQWMGLTAHMDGVNNVYKILFDKPRSKRCMGELGIDGRIMVKWMLRCGIDLPN